MPRHINRTISALAMTLLLILMVLMGRQIVATSPDVIHAWATLTPTITPSSTPTPTPTSTPSPTPTHTPIPTQEPTITLTSAPTSTPTPMILPHGSGAVILTSTTALSQPLPIPSPMPLVEQADNVRNILLLGSDQPAVSSGGLTDVIIILSINPDLPAVSMLSVPRDFYAWIPSHGFNKINTAYNHGARHEYPGGGPGLIKAVIEYNFGIPIDYYVRVGFSGFINIVDTLGGVDVAVECPLSDTFPDPSAPEEQTDVDWLPGIHHLDGKHALWYARSRWSTSDFDRNRRQHQILRGLYRQILSLDMIPKIPQLWGAIQENVATDLQLNDLLYLANVGARMDMTNIKSRFVGRQVLRSWTAPNGGAVLVPHYEALVPLVEEAVAPPASGRAAQRAFRVEVWNATPYGELGFVAAERLRWEGFIVTNIEAVEEDYPRTQIVDYTTTSKGSPVYRLMSLYRRERGDVVAEPTEERDIDFRVILGSDYDPCAATKAYWYTGGEALPTPTPLPQTTRIPTATPVATETPSP